MNSRSKQLNYVRDEIGLGTYNSKSYILTSVDFANK